MTVSLKIQKREFAVSQKLENYQHGQFDNHSRSI